MTTSNVTDYGFRQYLEVFHSTLRETAEEFLAREYSSKLLHLSFLPARIVGYVSTQCGVAYEYFPAENTIIEIIRGSSTIEDLVIQAPKTLRGAVTAIGFYGAQNAGVFRCTFDDCYPFRLEGKITNLSVGECRIQSGFWQRYIHYAEFYGNRDATNWGLDKAVARAKNEVLAALVEVERAKTRRVSLEEYISRHKEKTVLLLGSYTQEGEQRLQTMAAALRVLGYEPLLVRDIPDHPHQNLEQKVVTLGSISRFIVVDDSEKSGHIAEIEICKDNRWITILLRPKGIGSSWMTAGASAYSNVILETDYDPSMPQPALSESATWAEAKILEIEKHLSKVYPWRWAEA